MRQDILPDQHRFWFEAGRNEKKKKILTTYDLGELTQNFRASMQISLLLNIPIKIFQKILT